MNLCSQDFDFIPEMSLSYLMTLDVSLPTSELPEETYKEICDQCKMWMRIFWRGGCFIVNSKECLGES